MGTSGALRAFGAAVARRGPGWADGAAARGALDALTADAPGLGALDPALDDLVDACALTPTDRQVVAVALLAETHPVAHLLCGLLAGDGAAGLPTTALAVELAGASVLDPAAHGRFAPGAALRRAGLLRLVAAGTFATTRVGLVPRVVAHLLGRRDAAAEVRPLLTEAVPADVTGYAEVAAALAADEPLVWVHAPVGAAGTGLAVAACRELDVACVVVDLERVPAVAGSDGPARAALHDAVRAAQLEAVLGRCVLVLAGAHLPGPDLVRLVTDGAVPVVAVGGTVWDPRWAGPLPPTVTAGRLTLAQRAERWAAMTGPDVATADVVSLRMTPEEIVRVGRRARADAARDSRDVDVDDVRRTARRLGGAAGSRVRTQGTAATLDDLVLPDHTRREVERLVAWARHRDDVLALGDLHGKGGKGTGISALFSGSPGTGKTLAAHVVADTLGMDLFQVDLSSVVDKYIGETEKNLERVFRQAESLNAVLFFDEADALFGSRSAVTDAKDRYANQEVAYLLQRMEAAEGLTILATNLRGNLDPAFARRLHFMVHFPDPDVPTRRALWQHHLAQLPATDPEDPVDLDLLAETVEVCGGDIRNVVLAATYDAVTGGVPLGMRHVRAATEREIAKLGRRLTDPRW
ncbi:ATP-binding protein [Cellulomonas sp. zg-ZUI222]|uniref:ATP-binding protein n=1 Tax=Cellulomonas wangleii TaxID=2816956 RepID=A0ABX8D304_9CELL|nr:MULTISPECIES: ATP-binding protein [Cellulomonas]MBO0899207.1 ATP-binding protein [Cellulomonas sp. zg-ZUI22]MBO0920057.1 ATP-binding protein [Cellulomonas wangleii]MBO0923514.1 ATP-binding protein [Cellulomonas wangleii]QVI61854.1 ATP-binding protein [Cellulomonas wangleii]